jgi:uncharacterized protein YndB with AHSA1/START domain
MNNELVIIERNLNVPAIKVWTAITNRDQMAKWYFNLKEFKPEVGFEFSFTGGPPDKVYIHLCKITEVEYCKKITYSWRYEGYEGISYVTFELFAGGGKNQTRLKLTHSGLETFPANNPDLAKRNFVAGWTDIIGRSLKEYLEK